MSAIWGIISLKNASIESIFELMTNSMSMFSFDRTSYFKSPSACYACGHQHLTNMSEKDISPYYDNQSNIIFLSDCFLYNREHIIHELNNISLNNSGDSQIAFMAFKKWGYSFVEKLQGSFNFVIYDKKSQSVHLFSDQLSTRYFVYCQTTDFICFSTTYKPVLACLGKNVRINREFILNAYSSVSAITFYKESITPYENVFHLDYATHVTFSLKTGEKTIFRYWNPLKKVKPLCLKSDEEYKNHFRNLFHTTTSQLLRSSNETGILLSGGLDSSSVAAFAAPILNDRNKKLYSYTSIPCQNFNDEITQSHYVEADESHLVKVQSQFHPNLETRFIQGNDSSCASDIDYFESFFDLPINASANSINIINMIRSAAKDNCSVLLSGSNGNATISYGYLSQYISLNFTRFRFHKAYKEMSKFAKTYHFSRKRYLKKLFKDSYETIFKKPEEPHEFLRPEDEKKYGLSHVEQDNLRLYGTRAFVTQKQRFNFLIRPIQFMQTSFFFTYLGLKHHLIALDPTLTVPMIEFCISAPLECFVHNGIERRLVRDYLKDLLPEEITDMRKKFGLQAADNAFRANRDFDKNKEAIYKNLDEPLINEYLDKDKVSKIVEEIKKSAERHCLDNHQCMELTQLAYLGCFLRNHTYN